MNTSRCWLVLITTENKYVNTDLTSRSLHNSSEFYGKWFIGPDPRMQPLGRINLANLFNACFNKLSGLVSFLCVPHPVLIIPSGLCSVINPPALSCESPKAPCWQWRMHAIICRGFKVLKCTEICSTPLWSTALEMTPAKVKCRKC